MQNVGESFQISNPRIDQYEKNLIREFWGTDDVEVNRRVEAACARWACISSKSHRDAVSDKVKLSLEVYENLFKVTYKYDSQGSRPPTRTGDPIQTFSKKSRMRLINKTRMMRKAGLSLPYFVTLTYHENMTDCREAKRHLDNFNKRWRRRCDDFRYIWKMEFQKRGAVHFHMAMFLPDDIKRTYTVDSSDANKRLRPLRELIAADWQQVTDGSDLQLKVGTNVREVENWKMCTGYMAKYLGKEVKAPDGFVKPPFKHIVVEPGLKIETLREWQPDTGRFWGFSRNFDFSAIHQYATDTGELDKISEICADANDSFYEQYLSQQRDNWRRAKKQYTGKKLMWEQERIRAQVERQARRYAINKEKILEGRSVQYELFHEDAREIIKQNIQPITATDYFEMSGAIWQCRIDDFYEKYRVK